MKNILHQLAPKDLDRQSKDTRNRITRFLKWCLEHDISLNNLDLASYRNFLFHEGFSAGSVKAHLSTVRGWIKNLIKNGELQNAITKEFDSSLTLNEIQLHIDALVGQVREAILPSRASVTVNQPRPRNLNLTDSDINQWLNSIEVNSLLLLRDFSLIFLMIATGIREAEVCSIEVKDLDQLQDDMPGLHIPERLGCIERWIPYQNDVDGVSQAIAVWLDAAGIESGPVFRGLYKTGKMVRNEGLSIRTIARILASYPILDGYKATAVKPLDLRHVYARHQYLTYRVGIDTLMQYLGVKTTSVAVNYLGNALHPHVEQDCMPYDIDLAKLNFWKAE